MSNNYQFTIPEIKVNLLGGPNVIKPSILTFDAPPSEIITDAAYTLKYDNTGRVFGNANAKLNYRYIRNVVVKKASDDSLLVLNTDYKTMEDGALIYGLINTSDIPVKLSYTGYQSRFDLVSIDLVTGNLSITKGTDRIYDPEQYMPTVPAGNLPLYMVYIAGDKLIAINLYDWKGGIRDKYENEFITLYQYNRKCLSKTFGKALRGEHITLVGYGDSITNQGTTGVDMWSIPNGTFRDRESFYSAFPSDTISSFQRFDHGDGVGQVHVHLGWNWYLKEALEKLGATVTYLNLGIGGTRSANYTTAGDDNGRGGLEPNRLAAMLAQSPDLVCIGFGMNELGASDTCSNVANISLQCKNAGADVIIMGCPRINSLGGRASVETWRSTNQALWQAAISTNSAFVSTILIEDDGFNGFSGLAPHTFCASNQYNHPGPLQLKKIGEKLAEIFI